VVNQSDSAREGYLYWMGNELHGVKWHNFKLVLVAQRYTQDPADKLPTPRTGDRRPRRGALPGCVALTVVGQNLACSLAEIRRRDRRVC